MRKLWSLPIHWPLVLLPLVLALMLVALQQILSSRLLFGRLEDEAGSAIARTALVAARRTSQDILARANEMRLLAAWAGASEERPADLHTRIAALQQAAPAYAWIGLFDIRGRVLASSDGRLEGQDASSRPVFFRGRDRFWLGDLHPAKLLAPAEGPTPDFMDVSLPVRNGLGQASHVLGAHLDWRWVEALLSDSRRFRAEDEALRLVIVNAAGEVIAPSDAAPLPRAAVTRAGGQRWSRITDAQGTVWLAADARVFADGGLPDLGWRVIALTTQESALASAHALSRSFAIGGVILALLVALGGVLVSYRFSAPLLRWVSVAHAHADGDTQASLLNAASAAVDRNMALTLDPHLMRNLRSGSLAAATEAALQLFASNAARLQLLLDQLPLGLVVLLPDARIAYWNKRCETLLGYTAAEAIGRQPTDFLVPEQDIERMREAHRRRGNAARYERTELRRKDGRLVWFDWRSTALLSADGTLLGYLNTLQDISETIEALGRWRDSEALAVGSVEGISDIFLMFDEDGRIIAANQAACEGLAFSRDTLVALNVSDLEVLTEQGPVRQRWAPRPGDALGAYCSRLRRGDGTQFPVEVRTSAVDFQGRSVWLAVARDISSWVEAEELLRLQHDQLSALTQDLMRSEQRSQRQLAQVMHDSLGQTLSAMRYTFDALTRQVGAEADSALARSCAAMGSMIESAVAEVRSTLNTLRPPLLEELGLKAALENMLRGLRREDAPEPIWRVQVDSEAERPPTEVEHALFMVAREALENSFRHARASEISLGLEINRNAITVSVVDNGEGIAGGREHLAPGHLGLVGMRERAAAIGAQFELKTGEGGTAIAVTWNRA